MLQLLRNKAQSTFIQIIVVLIALVFIFWGVGTNMMNSRQAALTVNGEEISFQEFQQDYDRAYENLAAQFGGTLPKGLAETLGIKQQVINQLIQTTLLRQGASRMGLIVSQEEIQSVVNSMPQFQENGGFSLEKYKSLLASNRFTPNKFEAKMQFDMLTEKAVRDIGKFATLNSEYELQELYQQQNEQVSVTFTEVSPDHFRDTITISDEELSTWFETAKDRYQSEPQMQLKYLAYTYEGVGKKITIDDDKIQGYYQQNLAAYTTPEERRARHILIKTGADDTVESLQEKEQKAKEILQLANNSDDFAALAREYSEGPSSDNGGDLGFFAQGAMVPEFNQAVFNMQPGNISDPVKTQFGFHIIKLEEIKPGATTALDEVRDEIRTTLQSDEAKPLAFQLANSAYEGIIGAGSLQAFADAHPEETVLISDYFARNEPPENLATDQEFLNSAFALNLGELSSLIKTSSGYYIAFAEGRKESETPALENVKAQARADLIDIRAGEQAEKSAADLLARLQAGEEFITIAEEAGLTVEDSGFLVKNGQSQSTFPASLVSQAFRLSSSEPFPEKADRVGNLHYVYVFGERKVPEISADEDELQQYRATLRSNKQQEILAAYLANLEKNAEITRHKSL